jgi:predicted RNA-binding Zn-ribbon protein involved in translation (DUF1610 family)
MTGIILQGKAIKVVNKGGGRKCKTINLGGGRRQMLIGNKEKGTDYVVFECPGCGQRNKRSAYQVKGSSGTHLSFKCHRCYREIEVAPPTDSKIILDPRFVPRTGSGIVGLDGRPL